MSQTTAGEKKMKIYELSVIRTTTYCIISAELQSLATTNSSGMIFVFGTEQPQLTRQIQQTYIFNDMHRPMQRLYPCDELG